MVEETTVANGPQTASQSEAKVTGDPLLSKPESTPASQPDLTTGSPLQILRMANKKFTLMKEELQKILMREDVKDSPVAVVSITGAFRGGKSFMLDYFLRYLQATPEKRKDGTWLGDKDQPLRGFSWRGGSERHTLGVLIWSEPYFVNLDNGEKVGSIVSTISRHIAGIYWGGCTKRNNGRTVTVLVVDTQGIFDNESSVNDCSTIFAFSNIISSLILFNVRENIKEDDLNHLHLFSKFGEMIKTDKGKIYQNLEFLVRDFPFPDETPYGLEGGQMLIDKRLEIKKDQALELQDVRKDLLASYEKISAFLMPHPGFEVLQPNFDGRWAVLTEDFKTYLKVLTDSIFDPSKIITRKIGGSNMTGRGLFEYIKSFMEIFESDEIPTMQTITKATIEAGLRLAFSEASEYYQKHMEAEVGDSKPSLSAAAVNQIHKKFKKEGVDGFHGKITMGDDKDIEPYLAKLRQDLEAQLHVYLVSNHVKLQKSIKDGNDAYFAFIKSVHKDNPLCLTPTDMMEAHKDAVTAGRRAFDSNRRQVDGVPDEERSSFLERLEENYSVLRSKNNLNNMAAVNELILSYKSFMDSNMTVDPPLSENKLHSIHDEQLRKAKSDLDAKRNHIHASDDDPYKATLVSRISDSYINYRLRNRLRNKLVRQRAYYKYTNNMSDYWDSDDSYNMCVPPDALKNVHESNKRIALNMLRDGYCSDDECDLLKRMIDSHYEELKEVNSAANQRFEDKAYRIYKNYMDDKCSFNGWWVLGIPYLVNKSNRYDYHNEAKYEAERYFDNHRQEYRYDVYYMSLENRMTYAYWTYYE